MRGVGGALVRWLIVVAMGIATFLPEYGLAFLSYKYFLSSPFLVTILDLIWVVALTLVLPFTLRAFRWISTVSVAIISSVSVYLIRENIPVVFEWWPIYMWAVVIVSVSVGWLLVSTALWRWAKGMLPVTQTDPVATQPVDHHH